MEKMIATFLKALGLSPELIMAKVKEIFDGVNDIRTHLVEMRKEIAELKIAVDDLRGVKKTTPKEPKVIDWLKAKEVETQD